MKVSDLTKRIDEFETGLRALTNAQRTKTDTNSIVQYTIQVASFLYELSRKVDKKADKVGDSE